MTDKKDTLEAKAQAIRDRVERANDYRVLNRMRVHGFWPKDQGLPEDPPDEAKERLELEAKKQTLTAQAFSSTENLQKALDEERARRIKESREKRAQRLKEKAAAALARRAAWAKQRATRIVHAGVGVSSDLEKATSDEAKLLARGLPILHSADDVARLLGVTLGQLRFLTFHRRTATLVHYHRFEIPKKTGGTRRISAPKPRLKAAQRVVFEQILARLHDATHLGESAHGFVATRSVVSNATPHVGKAVVVNLDLKDFFPSVTFGRVRGLFKGFGYSGVVATLLALLCTEPPRVAVDVDGRRVQVAVGARQLPQGACTSPPLTNLLCRRLDARLRGLATTLGYSYTRYADDLTFSATDGDDVNGLLFRVRRVLVDEGFVEHPDKTRVMRRGRRQEVTGVVVNQRPAVAREDVRRLRAVLHQAKRDGLAAQRRPGPDGALPSVASFVATLRGQIAWVQMVDREKGDRLRAALDALVVAPI
jgi:RNA-directed DNA polymerase